MSDILTVNNLDTTKLSNDIKTKLNELCKVILNKELKDCNKTELGDLLSIDMNSAIETMNIYCQSSRQISQFNPNSYSISQTISLKGSYTYISEQLKLINSPEEKLNRYVELRILLMNFINYKYESIENQLRNLLRMSEEKDGAPALGRFS